MALLRLFCALGGEVLRLTVPRATALCESRLAAREETTAVRGKHFENRFPLRLSLQKLFKPFFVFFVLFVLFVLFVFKILRCGKTAAQLPEKPLSSAQ